MHMTNGQRMDKSLNRHRTCCLRPMGIVHSGIIKMAEFNSILRIMKKIYSL